MDFFEYMLLFNAFVENEEAEQLFKINMERAKVGQPPILTKKQIRYQKSKNVIGNGNDFLKYMLG